MQLIKNNPYRIVGLLVGAKAKVKDTQIRRLKQFIDAEQEPENDFSFPKLGKLNRTIDVVNDAASKLNLDNDKMNAALFWFYKGNEITDEPAFDLLKDGKIKETASIWTKLVKDKPVESKNASAFQNLSTLLLNHAIKDDIIKENLFEDGIWLKLKFLESDFVKDLKALATDETYRTTKKELQLTFLNQVQSEIEKHGGITSNKFLEILNKQEFTAKEDFLKGFVQKPIEQIESKIQGCKKKRKGNDAKAGEIGNELYISTQNDLSILKSILGITDIKFISISDKLANELLQCGITLFNHFHETKTEVGEIALALSMKARLIALGSVIKERINESTPIVERYIQGRPEREKQNIVGDDLKFITSKIEMFKYITGTISNALNFANSCKPHLDNIKLKLGDSDDLYLDLSTTVVDNAIGTIILIVNNDVINSKFSIDNKKTTVSAAWSATVSLESFDMTIKKREHYVKNKDSLKSLYLQIDNSITFFEDTPIKKWIFWVGGIIFVLCIVLGIWGEEGLMTLLTIFGVIAFFGFIGWIQNNNR